MQPHLPELGIGRVQGELGGILQEWLTWHDAAGNPYPLPQELIQQLEQQLAQAQQQAEQARQRAEQEHQRAEQARQRAEQMEQALAQERLANQQLLERLRELGGG
jgi:ribosomal protein L16 Arg81 hydroxylase